MGKRTLIIATRNKGKTREIKEILIGIPFEIKSLTDIGLNVDVDELGKTFAENAILKTKTIGEKTGMWTLADDSGLEVDALGGKPGIHSARYTEGTDLDRINKLLKKLRGVPKKKRTARFKTVVALYIPYSHSGKRGTSASRIISSMNDSGQARMTVKNRVITFEGISNGYITENPIGTNGFGYDPIFFNFDLGKTNGEATLIEKNRFSHRAKALQKLKNYFTSFVRSNGDL